MAAAKKFKAKQLRELRKKSKKDLLKQCDDLKKELHQLRVAQVSGGAPAKVANIRTTRKNIARIYTIISQITKQKVREEITRRGGMLPLDLRPKLTKRERMRLPNELRFKKTGKQKLLIKKFPRRKFAVIDKRLRLSRNVRMANTKSVLGQKKASGQYRYHINKRSLAVLRMERKKKQRRKKQQKTKKDKKSAKKDKKPAKNDQKSQE